MRIGRGTSKRVYVPNSSNSMFTRAERQVEAHAQAKAEQFNNALNVDGPNMVFWANHNGAVPCSCRATSADSVDANIFDTQDGGDTTKVVVGDQAKTYSPASFDNFRLVKDNRPDVTEYKAPYKSSREDEIFRRDVEEYIENEEWDNTDIVDALSDEPSGSLTDTFDPFKLFADKIIQCPICLGTGYIDAMQPNNGLRMVFDTSNQYNFYCDSAEIDDTQAPTLITLRKGQSIKWVAKLPMFWDSLIRCHVYHMERIVPPDWYILDWAIPSLQLSGYVNPESLQVLQNVDYPVIINLRAKEDFQLTHAEFIFMFAGFVRGQIPEIPQAYEDEFADWQANVTFELPTWVNVEEGDYIVEDKYKKVWKITSILPKKTTSGTVFGVSVEVRALMSFEKLMSQLSVFRATPYGQLANNYPRVR